MAIEETKNRDLFFKIVLFYYLMHILKVLGINEKLKEILSTEIISMEITSITQIFDNLMDFKILTESGKIIIFEFKKYTLKSADFKQLWDYYRRVECEEKREVIPILITITEKGEMEAYKMEYCTFHPKIIKTKSKSKQKDLNIIRDKVKHDKILTPEQCSILVTLPLFKTDSEESEIVEEVCGYIKNKRHCIPEGEYRKMVIPMYLNIVEYIVKDNQKELMEAINVAGEIHGEFAKIRQQGRLDGKFEIIEFLLKKHSINEIAQFFGKSVLEIENILNRKF